MSSKQVIDSIKRTLAMNMPEGGQAFLYGSRARGDNKPDSDWDVLILLDKPRLEMSDYINVSYPLTVLGCDIGEQINPMLYTNDDWQKYSFTPFYHNVTEEGIRL